MEHWDVLNRNGRPTGRVVSRGGPIFRKGEYHLVVHVWITDGNGNFLIQRRSDDKPLMPGEWAAVGGAAVSGESSITAARRELAEEMGLVREDHELRYIGRLPRRTSLIDIYAAESHDEVLNLRLQSDEVAEARWVSFEDLKRRIKDGGFHDYGDSYFALVFTALGLDYEQQTT